MNLELGDQHKIQYLRGISSDSRTLSFETTAKMSARGIFTQQSKIYFHSQSSLEWDMRPVPSLRLQCHYFRVAVR